MHILVSQILFPNHCILLTGEKNVDPAWMMVHVWITMKRIENRNCSHVYSSKLVEGQAKMGGCAIIPCAFDAFFVGVRDFVCSK